MRVYKKHESSNFTYPDEMKCILDYLDEHGTLFVSGATIEKLYYEFSEDKYSASWICVNDDVLKEFAKFKKEKQMEHMLKYLGELDCEADLASIV